MQTETVIHIARNVWIIEVQKSPIWLDSHLLLVNCFQIQACPPPWCTLFASFLSRDRSRGKSFWSRKSYCFANRTLWNSHARISGRRSSCLDRAKHWPNWIFRRQGRLEWQFWGSAKSLSELYLEWILLDMKDFQWRFVAKAKLWADTWSTHFNLKDKKEEKKVSLFALCVR